MALRQETTRHRPTGKWWKSNWQTVASSTSPRPPSGGRMAGQRAPRTSSNAYLALLPAPFKHEDELRTVWSNRDTRRALLERPSERGYDAQVLLKIRQAIMAEKRYLFDLLAHIACATEPVTKAERAGDQVCIRTEAGLSPDLCAGSGRRHWCRGLGPRPFAGLSEAEIQEFGRRCKGFGGR